jgi:hypothetical protein
MLSPDRPAVVVELAGVAGCNGPARSSGRGEFQVRVQGLAEVVRLADYRGRADRQSIDPAAILHPNSVEK